MRHIILTGIFLCVVSFVLAACQTAENVSPEAEEVAANRGTTHQHTRTLPHTVTIADPKCRNGD